MQISKVLELLLILFLSFCSWFRTIGAFARSVKLSNFSSEWAQSVLHVVAPKSFANAAWLTTPQWLLYFMFMDQWPGTFILKNVLKYWKVAVFTLCACHWTSGTIKCCLNYRLIKGIRLLLGVCQAIRDKQPDLGPASKLVAMLCVVFRICSACCAVFHAAVSVLMIDRSQSSPE